MTQDPLEKGRIEMRVLITGGVGFIGSHIADLLRTRGHQVRLLDALLPTAHGSQSVPDHLGDFELIRGDVREQAVLRRALSGIDVVCHQAAMVGLETGMGDMPDYVAHNDLGTARLLAEMTGAGIGQLVLASSTVVYGEGRYSCDAHGPVRPGPRSPPTSTPASSNRAARCAAARCDPNSSRRTPRWTPATPTR